MARMVDRARQAIGSWSDWCVMSVLAALVLLPFLAGLAGGSATLRKLAGIAAVLLLVVLAGIASRLLFVAACLLLAASGVVHQHVARRWGVGQFDARVEAFFESPPGEIRQYLETHVDAIDVVWLVAALGYAALLFHAWRRARPIPGRTRAIAGLLLAVGIALVATSEPERRIKSLTPIEPVWRTLVARHRYLQLEERSQYLQRHPLESRSCSLKYDKVVIAIGESAVTDRMGIFGYGLPTTPYAVESRAHAFEALAPSNQTRFAVAMMFTGARPGAFDPFFTSHSLVGELRACGYHTVWISNQGRRGEWDSFSTSLANEADEQVFLNDWSWSRESDDGLIVDEVVRGGHARRRRQATFLHLIGSHTDYEERYPRGFGFPGADTVGEHYDNSILYTDLVLSRLHREFADAGTLFLYAADHGQMVSESKFGSGFLPGYQEEFRTPLLIWTDDAASIARVRQALGGAALNLQSLDDLVRFLIGMSAAPAVSTSTRVSVLGPENVREYRQLSTLPGD